MFGVGVECVGRGALHLFKFGVLYCVAWVGNQDFSDDCYYYGHLKGWVGLH